MIHTIGNSQHQPIFAEGCSFKTCTEALMSLIEKVRTFFASLFQTIFCCFSSEPTPISPERVSSNSEVNNQVSVTPPPIVPEPSPQGDVHQGQSNLGQQEPPANAAAIEVVPENQDLVHNPPVNLQELGVIEEDPVENSDGEEEDASVDSVENRSLGNSEVIDDYDDEKETHLHPSTPEEVEVGGALNEYFDEEDIQTLNAELRTPRKNQGSTSVSSSLRLIRNLQTAPFPRTQARSVPRKLTPQEKAELLKDINTNKAGYSTEANGLANEEAEDFWDLEEWDTEQTVEQQTKIDADESDEKEMTVGQSTGPITLPQKTAGFLAAFELALAVFDQSFSEENIQEYLREGIGKLKYFTSFDALSEQFKERELDITCSSISQLRKVWIDNFKVEFNKKKETRCIVLSNRDFSNSHAIYILPLEEDQVQLGLFSPNAVPATFQIFDSFDALKAALPKSGKYHAYEIEKLSQDEEARSLLDEVD